jgi:hypothetical protein
MWQLQLIQLRFKMRWMYLCSTSVAINNASNTYMLLHARLPLCNQRAVATGTITVTAPTGTGITYSIDGATYTNTTGIFTNVAAATYSVTVKMLQDVYCSNQCNY